jgi:ABC-type Na+ transport system ATPase subunit NatA
VFLMALSWIISAVLLGIISPGIGNDGTGTARTVFEDGGSIELNYYSLTSAVFSFMVAPMMLISFSVPTMHKEYMQMREEINAGLINQMSAWLSFLCGDLPIYVILALVYGAVARTMLDFRGSPGTYDSVMVSLTCCFYALAMCCAVVSQSTVFAALNYLRCCGFSIIFCGYYEPIPELASLWKALTFASPSRWAFESFMLVAYSDLKNADDYLEHYDFDGGSAGTGICWLLVWFGSAAALALFLTTPVVARITRAPFTDKSSLKALKTGSYTAPEQPEEDDKEIQIPLNTADLSSSGGGAAVEASEQLSPKFMSHLVGQDSSGKDDSVLSFPALAESVYRGSQQTSSLRASRLTGHSSNVDAPVSRIPAEDQLTLSFNQVSYIANDGDIAEGATSSSSAMFTAEELAADASANAPPGMPGIAGGTAVANSARDVLLEGITGKAVPRRICGILDGSGEGSERILLRVLSGHADMTGEVKGEIKINGQIVPQGARLAGVALIPTKDAGTLGCLTVREVIRFAALLRRTDQNSCPALLTCKRRMNSAGNGGFVALSAQDRLIGKSGDVEERVQEVIDLMGLSLVADKIIGEASGPAVGAESFKGGLAVEIGPLNDGITAAQRRCLTIGVEMVNRPSLIFLENPLYGLDRYSSQQVCNTLKYIASGDRTLVCSIQTPPPLHVFDFFDDLLLLGRGLLIYSGPSAEAVAHFDNIGE